MSSTKPFQAEDLFEINAINLDALTENFNLQFYFQYLLEWPSIFFKSVEIGSNFQQPYEISGYMMAKNEGKLSRKEWHTHITAVTVNSQYRRIGLASDLCLQLENLVTAEPHKTLFIDLFVRVTNVLAQQLYEKLGYSVYRRVVGYYGRELPADRNKIDDSIDAYDMRKLLPADVDNETVRADGHRVFALPHEIVF